jgi:hypothetical protein
MEKDIDRRVAREAAEVDFLVVDLEAVDAERGKVLEGLLPAHIGAGLGVLLGFSLDEIQLRMGDRYLCDERSVEERLPFRREIYDIGGKERYRDRTVLLFQLDPFDGKLTAIDMEVHLSDSPLIVGKRGEFLVDLRSDDVREGDPHCKEEDNDTQNENAGT